MNGRYARNVALAEIGEDGQRRISAGRVLIVGAGALGSVTGLYLAGAGVGHIGVADFDTVDVSNLQRQIAYTEADAGCRKSEVLCARMHALNSDVDVRPICKMVTRHNLNEIVSGYDVVTDCSDNAATKHFLARAVTALGKVCVTAGVSRFTAQVTTSVPGGASFGDIFGESAPAAQACGGILPCQSEGVLGPAAGVAAACQSAEVLKVLAGAGKTLAGRLLLIDTLDFSTITLSIS